MSNLLIFSVLVSLVYLIWMRKKLLEEALKLDIDAFTPSDFCLMGMNMKFDDYNPETMKEKVKAHFENKYSITDIQYINFAFDIADFYKLTERFNELTKHQMLVKAYCKQNDYDEDKYTNLCQNPDACPDDFPKAKDGLFGTKVINIKIVDAELEATQAKIEEYEKKTTENEGSNADEVGFLGIAFVVLSKPSDCHKVIKKQSSGFIMGIFKFFFGCCMNDESLWEWERAPEPSDIYWENLGVSTCGRICYSVQSYVATVLLMAGCLVVISLIKLWQAAKMEEYAGKELSFEEQGTVKFISALASFIVVFVNTVLIYVIRRFSIYEHHETQTKMNVSVAIKLTIARFLNSSVILVITNRDPKTWFDGGDLVYDASLLIMIMVFQQPFMYLINIPGWIRWIKIIIEKGKEDDCKLTQREANLLCEGPPIDVANNVANFMNLMMTCIFYSPIIPQAIPAALIGGFLNYWVFKYMLLRKHKMPEMFSELMASFFANFMPWIVLTWAIAYMTFLMKITVSYEDIVQIAEEA